MTVAPVSVLTRRQRDVLALMLAGYTHVQIADELVLSESTVKLHAQTIYKRLQIGEDVSRGRGQADRRALYAWAFAVGVLRVRL